MSEIERNKVEDVDAIVEVVAEAQRADRKRVVPVEDHIVNEAPAELIREFKRWHRRQGWDAFGLACFHSLNVMACCAALMGNYWQLVLVGLAAANLLMVGGWLGKAKGGWDA